MLGLTAVSLNRVLQWLRERGLATSRGGGVAFHDLLGLRALAGHHGGYLDQGEVPAEGNVAFPRPLV